MNNVETTISKVKLPTVYDFDHAVSIGNIKNDEIIKHWKPIWTRNALQNYEFIDPNTMNLRSHFKIHDGKTCVIVSSGPSLDHDLEELKKIDRSRYTLISTTSALNPVLANGLVPEYASINDGAPWVSALHYEGLYDLLSTTTLIASTVSHQLTLKKWPGPILLYHDYSPELDLMDKDGPLFTVWPQFTGIPVGGCTTNLTLRVSALLGFTKILTIGMDLSFNEESAHCTKYSRKPDGSFSPVSQSDHMFKGKAILIMHGCPDGHGFVIHDFDPETNDLSGKTKNWNQCVTCEKDMMHKPTSPEYLFYLRDLSSLIHAAKTVMDLGDGKEERNIEIIDCTLGGIARCINMRHMDLSDVFS